MKRTQALLFLIILLSAPFLKAPAYFFCSMGSGAPKAACCCPSAEGAASSCCRIIPVPLGERLASTAPVVAAPDLVGLLLPLDTPAFLGADLERAPRRWEFIPARPPDRPLYLLHSSLLS